jgi:N-acetylglucosamine-6-phosphate deacetylase
MIHLRGATLVLPDKVIDSGTLVIDRGEIVDVRSDGSGGGHDVRDLRGCVVVPGFIDVHVHGVESHDTLDAGAPVEAIARRLPRYGVTAFCPTTVACSPSELGAVCGAIRRLRAVPPAGAARVLPAHLESNFINPEYRGAQPLTCLRLPPAAGARQGDGAEPGSYTGADVRAAIAEWQAEVGIVTLAPELDGAVALVRDLVAHGHRVSLGHSGAGYEAAQAGIEAGARHATHLFNRMPPLHHRQPGLVGAVLSSEEVSAEIVCDGYHVHPAVVHSAVAAKTPARTMAITDGTGGSGLPVGAHASLGGRRITVGEAAFLDDGTLAGSVLTMDRAFRFLARTLRLPLVAAARMCATTPADALKLGRQGRIAAGMLADLVVLGDDLEVRETWVGGERVFAAAP